MMIHPHDIAASRTGWLLSLSLLAVGCRGGGPPVPDRPPRAAELQLKSSALRAGQPIPPRFTADGRDLSPPLEWSSPPAGTLSLALLCDDPDAPRGDWVHWVLYNLPPDLRELKEGKVPDAAVAGSNDFGKLGYNGPSPPPGKAHRYVFHLFALDIPLKLSSGASKSELLRAIEGHVVGQGELTAPYQRTP